MLTHSFHNVHTNTPYPAANPFPEQEHAVVQQTAEGLRLVYYISQPADVDCTAFTQEVLCYGVVVPVPGLPFILMQFGQTGWMLDAPVNLQGQPAQVMREPQQLHLVLVDASTNVVVTQRRVQTEPRFTQLLQEALVEQATHVGDAQMVTAVAALLQRDNTTESLLAAEDAELFWARD